MSFIGGKIVFLVTTNFDVVKRYNKTRSGRG
jgi:hypothetical protein